ncbi:MAG: protein-L-isoaspartate O-methyltransferase family protein [Rhizomicrobium sp.]
MTEAELAAVRRAYAMQVLAGVGVTNARLEAAYAAVRREDFCGPGPWQIFRFGQAYMPTPAADPVYLYTDDLVGLVPERRINNGQPSLHAHLLNQAGVEPGEHIVHIGTGAGYYTAIMAELVGPEGKVTGIEFDEGLAGRARENLAGRANVEIVRGDGTVAEFAPADVIYVNAGATRPADIWLDRLKAGGRLILPLTTDTSFGVASQSPAEASRLGAVFRITRKGEGFDAKWISAVAIFPCEGGRDAASERALFAAFEKGPPRGVTRLLRRDATDSDNAWLSAPGWCLA